MNEHILRKIYHCTFCANLQFTFFTPKNFYLSIKISDDLFFDYLSILSFIHVPLFLLLQTSISFLHNSSLQKPPVNTAHFRSSLHMCASLLRSTCTLKQAQEWWTFKL